MNRILSHILVSLYTYIKRTPQNSGNVPLKEKTLH